MSRIGTKPYKLKLCEETYIYIYTPRAVLNHTGHLTKRAFALSYMYTIGQEF